jgi:hypothetical protein
MLENIVITFLFLCTMLAISLVQAKKTPTKSDKQ